MSTRIQWTDETFNPWVGCQKISPGCLHCYAETMDNRFNGGAWGKDAPRRTLSESNWKRPIGWNRIAERTGQRMRVFCGSMCDVFDPAAPPGLLDRLFATIEQTPCLNWQLLTKRPELAPQIQYPSNVWLGVSAETATWWSKRVKVLQQAKASCKFISYEPALGPPPVSAWLYDNIDWVIVGGESGPEARPFHAEWALEAITKCQLYGINVFVKQLGANPHVSGHPIKLKARKGDEIDEWPKSLRVREFPGVTV